MIVLNFGHPLTGLQMGGLVELLETSPVSEIKQVACQIDVNARFADEARRLADMVGWTGEQWQDCQFLLRLPGLADMAGALLAEIHGRCGYFPTLFRLKSLGGSSPVFVAAELCNLYEIRSDARTRR